MEQTYIIYDKRKNKSFVTSNIEALKRLNIMPDHTHGYEGKTFDEFLEEPTEEFESKNFIIKAQSVLCS